METMSGTLAPEPVLRAALRALHVAGYTTQNWTLSDGVPWKEIKAFWEAIHEIPDLITRWHNDEDSLQQLRLYLQEYDKTWPAPKLEQIFDQALNDSSA